MPLKPKIEPEIPQSRLFAQMILNSHINDFPSNESNINKEYLSQRKNIINILHKITTKMGFKSQIFFLSIKYLDIIFSSKLYINNKLNLHITALTCLILSAKFSEMDPYVPQLIYFIKIYYHIIGYKARNQITLQDLKYAEIFILQILNYKLNYCTIYDINSFLFVHGVLKMQQIKEITDEKNDKNESINGHLFKKILEKIYKKARYYIDIIVTNTKLCFKYDDLFLSIYIMKKSIEEILFKERNIALDNKERQNNFYLKQNNYFKEIMKNTYNVDYEKNEQYQKLLLDEEIKKIFGKNNDIKNIEENAKKNIMEINNKNIFNSTISEGLYKRLSGNRNSINNKFDLKFDIDILKNFHKKSTEKYKSMSKENNISGNKEISYNYNNICTTTHKNINSFNFSNNIYKSIEKRNIKPSISERHICNTKNCLVYTTNNKRSVKNNNHNKFDGITEIDEAHIGGSESCYVMKNY